jgi:hypothetical protein
MQSLIEENNRAMNTLRKVWLTWKRVGQFIGDQIGRVVLTLFYFTLLAPFGLGVRLQGDPLAIKRGRSATWLERTTRDREIADARRLS